MKKGVAGMFREVAARFLFWRFCVGKLDTKCLENPPSPSDFCGIF